MAWYACMSGKSLLSCLTLCGAMDHGLPGSSVHGILQARILEWVAMSSSRRSSLTQGRTPVSYISCVDRWVLYQRCHLGGPNDLVCTQLIWSLCFSSVPPGPDHRAMGNWGMVSSDHGHRGTIHCSLTCFFCPYHMACGILVPQPGVEPRPLAVKRPSLN